MRRLTGVCPVFPPGARAWWLHRENTVAAANSKSFDELYDHDLIDRLKSLDRGDLNEALAVAAVATGDSIACIWPSMNGGKSPNIEK